MVDKQRSSSLQSSDHNSSDIPGSYNDQFGLARELEISFKNNKNDQNSMKKFVISYESSIDETVETSKLSREHTQSPISSLGNLCFFYYLYFLINISEKWMVIELQMWTFVGSFEIDPSLPLTEQVMQEIRVLSKFDRRLDEEFVHNIIVLLQNFIDSMKNEK